MTDAVQAWAGLLSPVGCVIFLFYAFARGWLYPKSFVDELRDQWEDRLGESHNREQVLQEANKLAGENIRDGLDQVKVNQALGEVIVQALSAERVKDG